MTRAVDSIGITPGAGAEIATVTVGSKRHQVMVLSDEFGHMAGTVPTYRLLIPAQAVGASKVFFDLFHAAGTDRTIRILSLRALKDDGTATDLYLTRTTEAGTGGTAATYNGTSLTAPGLSPMDPANDDATAYITARAAPTGGATAGALVTHRRVKDDTELLGLNANDIQPVVIPAGTGVRVVQGALAGTGNVTLEVMVEIVGPPLIKPFLVPDTAEPTITGPGLLDEQHTVSSGTWDGYPTPVITFQWETWNGSDWVAVPGATAATYTPTLADDYRCAVTATSTAGAVTFHTTAVTVVSPYFEPSNSVAPDITGSTAVGSTLTCGVGTWVANPAPQFTYQWYRWDGTAFIAIDGATTNTYVTAHEGDHHCVVTATNDQGSNDAPSNVINVGSTTVAPSMLQGPQISGNAYTTSLLTCHPGMWSGDNVTFLYQWQSEDANGAWLDVTGETNATFTPSVAARYSCRVIARNDGGQAPAQRSNGMSVATMPNSETVHLNETFDAPGNWVLPTDVTISGGAINFKNVAANVTATKPLSLAAGTYTYEMDILAGDGATTKGNLTVRLESATYTSPVYTDVLGTVTGQITLGVPGTDVELRVTRQDSTMDIKVGRLVIKTPGEAPSAAPRLDYPAIAFGLGTVNEPLTVTNGVWFSSPDPTYTYLWQWFDGVSWIAASGTNNTATYTPTGNGDYRCQVTATNSFGPTTSSSNSITVTGASQGTGTYTRARVLFDELWGGAEPMVATLNFHATVGGIKLDGNVSASSEAGSLTSASKAHDTSIDSYWQSALDVDSVPWWMLITQNAVAIAQVTMAFPDVEDFYVAEAPRSFRIQGWDGAQWTTLRTVTNAPRWAPGETRTYNI